MDCRQLDSFKKIVGGKMKHLQVTKQEVKLPTHGKTGMTWMPGKH